MPMSRRDAAPPPTSRLAVWRTRHLLGGMLLLSVLLVALAFVAGEANPNAIDLGATRWLQQVSPPWFGVLMAWVSWFGFAPQNVGMPIAVAAAGWLRGFRREAVWIVGTQLSGLATALLKELVHRPRPAPELVGVSLALTDPSFPSGHTVQYTTLFGFAFFLLYVLSRPTAWRSILLVLLAIPIVTVGFSRLYLGQHWLSDVLGGYALAMLLLIPYCWVYSRTLERRPYGW
jgi:membrane-associated phospholipid phosphatase